MSTQNTNILNPIPGAGHVLLNKFCVLITCIPNRVFLFIGSANDRGLILETLLMYWVSVEVVNFDNHYESQPLPILLYESQQPILRIVCLTNFRQMIHKDMVRYQPAKCGAERALLVFLFTRRGGFIGVAESNTLLSVELKPIVLLAAYGLGAKTNTPNFMW